MQVTEPRRLDPARVDAAPSRRSGVLRRLLRALGPQNVGLILALALLAGLIRTQTDKVFGISNLVDIAVSVSILGVLAVAQMTVIISGGLDISIGSATSLCSVVIALLLEHGAPTGAAVLAGLGTGAAAGVVNGLLIVSLALSPIIVTLATFSAFAGIALVITKGLDVPVANHFFDVIGTERVAGIPYPVLILAVFALVTHAFLRYTVIGRHIFAMGSNEDAARNTGINLAGHKIGMYLFTGVAAGLAGLLSVARDSLGTANGAGADVGLTAITAALLGGAALTGGRGSVPGAILAVFILGLLDNGLVLMNANPFYSQIMVGVLLVAAVSLQKVRLPGRLTRPEAG